MEVELNLGYSDRVSNDHVSVHLLVHVNIPVLEESGARERLGARAGARVASYDRSKGQVDI